MPIIDVTLIGGDESAAPADCAGLARAIGQTLGAAEGSVWVTLTRRSNADYAENGPLPESPPVFVRVLAGGDGSSTNAAQAQMIAGAVAASLGRPVERVHVIFEPAANGRVYFRGRASQG